ncbi:FAD-dependent oxidoreductase [Vagococcus sp. DIV0080]|uniref:Urocanate reductase n=1 Tax=Candidatus Vagococcus giribetii TaxID=2230876 RepID=A0ABS3HRZ9_9ENTE|nr:FAD-dependent oxidoreductase [Vagococcus sp. DIV0080]MBO0476527.1 FAD-dependent oxidoreductase [Vagococcus sp. DIV0080]
MKKRFFVSLLGLSLLLTGCQQDQSQYKSGVYSGVGQGKNGDVKVEVTLSDKKIEKVEVKEHAETEDVAAPALERIPKEIVDSQSLDVDTVSGATVISEGIIDGTKDALKSAGVDTEKLSKKDKKATKKAEDKEISTDVVVVGAGAAGSSAAMAAVESGAKVTLLEKTAQPMGAGTLAGGMFAADSKEQKEKNKTVDKEWLYDKYLEASQGNMNSLLVRKIIDESGPTVDWLNENGVKLKLADAGTGGGYEHIGNPATLHGYQDGGTKAITNLIENFKKAGGDVYFDTPVEELLKDDNGKVSGVVGKQKDGSKLTVKAEKVILATGGFGGNDDMLKEYMGEPYTKGEIEQNKGDGVQMAWDAGAAKEGTEVAQYFWEKNDPKDIGNVPKEVGDEWYALTTFTKYPNLRVNTDGKRFSDETHATLYSVHGAEIASQPNQTEYVIVDSNMLNKIKKSGTKSIEHQFKKWENNRQFFMEFNEPNDTDEFLAEEEMAYDFVPLLDSLAGKGMIFKGNSVEELAKSMKVDEGAFKQSVKQYNDSIKSGKDDLFFADTKRLIGVDEGPYYAIKFVARNLGTLGGVRINENIQAVDAKGNVIPNLYVAGSDAGGMYGKVYVDFEGATLGFAYTSGRLAGLNASQELKK